MKKWLIFLVFAALLCMCSAVLAESVHVHSYDWDVYQYDLTHHWHVCVECGEKLYYGPHTVRCTSQNRGTCEVCGAAMGEGNISVTHAETAMYYDQEYHWKSCIACGEVFSRGRHEGACSAPGRCLVCGAQQSQGADVPEVPHAFNAGQYDYDYTSHWNQCSVCGEKVNREKHIASCAAPNICQTCGARASEGAVLDVTQHVWKQQFDAKYHWQECSKCGQIAERETHYASCASSDPGTCSVCGASSAAGADISGVTHMYSSVWYHDGDEHWHVCTRCGKKTQVGLHYALCVAPGVCAVCGADYGGQPRHETPSRYEQNGASGHRYVCSACGQTVAEPHVISSGVCIVCGYVRPAATASPTPAPTKAPVTQPTARPTSKPTAAPTARPTSAPTASAASRPAAALAAPPTGEPSPAPDLPAPLYVIEDFAFDGEFVTGVVRHVEGTAELEKLFLRMDVTFKVGGDVTLVFPAEKDIPFRFGVWGEVEILVIAVTQAMDCMQSDEPCEVFGSLSF